MSQQYLFKSDKKNVLLNSGGMDSFFVALEVPKLTHVFVDIGQKYAAKEQSASLAIAEALGQPWHPILGAQIAQFEHETGIIPFRNAELILAAAQFGERIHLGVIAEEVNSDKSPEFMRAMEQVLDISHRGQYWTEGRSFELATPLINRTKTELVAKLWADVGYRPSAPLWQAMLATVSCYDGGATHCGRCASCFKRWVALNAATGRDHGALFRKHPANWHPLSAWQAKGYSARRIAEIEQAYQVRHNGNSI